MPERVCVPVPESTITIFGYNRMASSCHLELCKNLSHVCVLEGLHACVAVFLFLCVCDFFLPAGLVFCVPVCVYACVSVCTYGHVFLMKAHAGQINSQKLRGWGSPSL